MKEKRKVKKQGERGEIYIHGIKVCQLVGCTKNISQERKKKLTILSRKT